MPKSSLSLRAAVLVAFLPVVFEFAGCNGSGGSTPSPTVSGFTATPASITAGQNSTLTWTGTNATSYTLEAPLSSATGTGLTTVTSPYVVTPAQSTIYNLSANGNGTAYASTKVTVTPVINSFTASPTSVVIGSSSTLSWSASGAAYYTLTGITGNLTATSQKVIPTATTTYTLTAFDPYGTVSATASLTVTVTTPAPVISKFTATPLSITAGQPVTLSWTVTNSTSLGINGVTASPISPVVVYPGATTTYTLTANNTGNSVTSSQTVTVTAGTITSTVTVGSTAGQQVPATFMGFSIGATSYNAILGNPTSGTNPLYRQLVKNLTQYGAGPFSMRIGGNAADTLTTIPTATTVSALGQLATDVPIQYILDVNMASENTSLATQQAQAYVNGIPVGSLFGMELGNEPDLYVQNGYRTTYTISQYLADYANFRQAVLPTLTPVGAKVAGPAWASATQLSNLPAFLAQEKSNLAVVTQHAYGGSICSGTNLAADYLLTETAQNGIANVLNGVAPTHGAGLPYRLGETNSVSCSGQEGLSDAFESALWAIDWSTRLAAGGVDGVNYFGNNDNPYSIFIFGINTTTTPQTFSLTTGSVRPMYYGLLMFQQATQNSGKFLPITLTVSGNQKVYAFLDASNTIRVLILNKDETQAGDVTFTLPTGYANGTTTRLLAPLYTSLSGVTLGGQTFDTSTTGTIQGNAYGEILAPTTGTTYNIAMPITSAVLITFPHQ